MARFTTCLPIVEPGRIMCGALLMLAITTPAFGQRSTAAQQDDASIAIRRCEEELQFRLSRQVGGRSPDVRVDSRGADVRQSGRDVFDISGQGRFMRDLNDSGRSFDYRCSVDLNSGRTTAQHTWRGSEFDAYDESDYPPPRTRGTGREAGVDRSPQGRTWFSGGIISRASSKALDVENRSTRNAANVQQWDYAGAPNQTWDIVDLGRGEFAIVSQGSNKVLDVMAEGGGDGANVVQFRWNGGDHQRWRLERAGGGAFRIVNVGNGRCLDLKESSQQNGADIQVWSCGGGPNQLWTLKQQ